MVQSLSLIKIEGNSLFLNEKVSKNIINKKMSVVFKGQTKCLSYTYNESSLKLKYINFTYSANIKHLLCISWSLLQIVTLLALELIGTINDIGTIFIS